MDKAQYKISAQLQADSRYVTYHAQQEIDGRGVLLKLPQSSYPTLSVIKRLEKEYQMLTRVSHLNIVKAQRMESYENSIAIVLENIQGLTLCEVLKNGLPDLNFFFTIAIPLTDAVKLLHYQRIIHN